MAMQMELKGRRTPKKTEEKTSSKGRHTWWAQGLLHAKRGADQARRCAMRCAVRGCVENAAKGA